MLQDSEFWCIQGTKEYINVNHRYPSFMLGDHEHPKLWSRLGVGTNFPVAWLWCIQTAGGSD